jgi:hypothetical protein
VKKYARARKRLGVSLLQGVLLGHYGSVPGLSQSARLTANGQPIYPTQKWLGSWLMAVSTIFLAITWKLRTEKACA